MASVSINEKVLRFVKNNKIIYVARFDKYLYIDKNLRKKCIENNFKLDINFTNIRFCYSNNLMPKQVFKLYQQNLS